MPLDEMTTEEIAELREEAARSLARRGDWRPFYVTFGQQYRDSPHPRDGHPDGYGIVFGRSEREARERTREAIGAQWSGLYEESGFSGEFYPLGSLFIIGPPDQQPTEETTNMPNEVDERPERPVHPDDAQPKAVAEPRTVTSDVLAAPPTDPRLAIGDQLVEIIEVNLDRMVRDERVRAMKVVVAWYKQRHA